LTGIMRWFATRRERAKEQEPTQSLESKASGPIERFWERAEVLGLWAAAGVGLIAILVSNNDAKEQLVALRAQLGAMLSAQRAWLQVTVIPASLQFDSEGAAVAREQSAVIPADVCTQRNDPVVETYLRSGIAPVTKRAYRAASSTSWHGPALFRSPTLCLPLISPPTRPV
jgi:hypothetical protein